MKPQYIIAHHLEVGLLVKVNDQWLLIAALIEGPRQVGVTFQDGSHGRFHRHQVVAVR